MNLSFPLRSAFIALPLEGEAKWRFQAYAQELEAYAFLSIQNPRSPHLTLHFWPSMMEIEYTALQKQAEKIAASAQPFTLQVTGAGTFGSRGEDHVLYFALAFSEELARLKKSCPWPDGKPFVPHITLARIRHPQRFHVQKKRIMKVVEDASFSIPIDRLRFYAEIEGRKQTEIETYEFFR